MKLMLNKNEILSIIAITIILAFMISVTNLSELFLYSLIFVFIIILLNIITKKIVSSFFNSEIEVKLWKFKRYGFEKKSIFKTVFQAGIFMPIIITGFSFARIPTWMASLVFEVKPKMHKTKKTHDIYNFSEMTDSQIGIIAATGIIINLVAAVISYFIGFENFTKLSIYFMLYNLIPISELDGNKIFSGSIVLWSFLASIVLIGLGFIFFVV